MKTPSELAPRDLIEIVTALQQALYLDSGAELTNVWNRDKQWDGADICDRLAQIAARYDLVPDAVPPGFDDASS